MIPNRKQIAALYADKAKQGDPPPCFVPDFSFDNSLYEEIGGLNEISVAMSKHSLHDTCQIRLQEVPPIQSISFDNDDVIFDSITPKSMDVSELLEYTHHMEHDVLESNKTD